MAKKRPDGYLRKSFTIDGKKYYVYGKNAKELFESSKPEVQNQILRLIVANLKIKDKKARI